MTSDTSSGGAGRLLFTVGHSTRTVEELLDLLAEHGIRVLADVRTVPRSRKNPQFNAEVLEAAAAERGIRYLPMKGLGGLRHPRRDSPNAAWRNASFRGYADYMGTEEFERHLEELADLASREPTAVMCAEAVPWRCHRSLIADALSVRGWQVEHLMGPGKSQPHRLTPFARVEGGRVSYPPPEEGPPEAAE